MKIILLSGKPNSGKTTALNLLCDELLKLDNWEITPALNQMLGECVLEYGNRTVAIVADGDKYRGCVEAIVKYAWCDVLVLAYSDKFTSSPTLLETVQKYVEKRQVTDKDEYERQLTEIRERHNGYHYVVEKNQTPDGNTKDDERVYTEIKKILDQLLG